MKNLILILAMSFGLGCATDPSEPTPPEEQESTTAASVEVMRTGTWQADSFESCFDFYLRPCSASLPPQQCPTAVDGQPCSIPDSWGWCAKRWVNNNTFQIFYCN